jgi:hypothetical protein
MRFSYQENCEEVAGYPHVKLHRMQMVFTKLATMILLLIGGMLKSEPGGGSRTGMITGC